MRLRFFTLMTSAALVAGLAGCATQPREPVAAPSNQYAPRPPATPVDIGADWNYMVSGDAAIRPVQVFSMGGKTYLQMRPQQVVPALVVGGQPIPFRISQPYIVVDGTPSVINLISDGYRAVVTRTDATPSGRAAAPSIERVQRVQLQ